MGISKKLRKQRKKNFMLLLFSTAVITSILAVMKLTGAPNPIETLGKLNTKNGLQTEYESSSSKTEDSSNKIVTNGNGSNNSTDVVTNLENEEQTESDSKEKTNTSINNDFETEAMMSSGNDFAVLLKKDGSVWTWGNNQYGQLGNGKTENVNTYEPQRVLGVDGVGYLQNIKQISVGQNAVNAITEDGKVVSWGHNEYAIFSNGNLTSSPVPVYAKKQIELTNEEGNKTTEIVDLDNIIQISQGANHVMALAADGTVWTWGINNYGQLGLNVSGGSRLYAEKVQMTSGSGLRNLDNIIQISAGASFSLALRKEGNLETIYAWGVGTVGQLGIGEKTTKNIPTPVLNLHNVKQISAGANFAIALSGNGTVWAWGSGPAGELGGGLTTGTATPVQVLTAQDTPLENIEKIATIAQTGYASTKEGKVYAWGLNNFGQVGNMITTSALYATKVKTAGGEELTGIKTLVEGGVGSSTNYMIGENGEIYGHGRSNSYQLMSDSITAQIFAKKLDETYLELSNNQEYIEIGETLNLTTKYHNSFNAENYQVTKGDIEYRSSDEDIVTVDSTGKITAKQRGIATIIAEDLTNGYIAESIINVISRGATALPTVETGSNFTVYLKEDGTVWTSGSSNNGQLGNGGIINVNKPTQVKISEKEYLTDIRKISAGNRHVLALRKDGSVWSWGYGNNGELGNRLSGNSPYAVRVVGKDVDTYLEDVVDIAAGNYHNLALKSDKTVYGWGINNALNVGNTNKTYTSIKVTGAYNVIQVQAGYNVTLLLKSDGTVWGTGDTSNGVLGDGTSGSTRYGFVAVTNNAQNGMLKGIVRISLNHLHSVALKEDKTAWTWGMGTNGELGNNNNTNSLYPIELAGPNNEGIMTNISNFVAGYFGTFIETKEGNVYATGANTNGELSLGINGKVSVFNTVKNETGEELKNVTTLGGFKGNTYGFAFDDGTVGVSGVGTAGQHGDGTWVNTNKITKIAQINLTSKESYEIEVDETAKINIGITEPFNLNLENNYKVELGELKYTSLNEEVVTVSEDGTITGISNGFAEIRVEDVTNNLDITISVMVGQREVTDIRKIVSGNYHTVLLKEDGTVWSWGQNDLGQLGNGEIGGIESEKQNRVLGENGEGYLTDVIDIAAGSNFTVALKRNGKVVAWGSNNAGQIGIGGNSPYPVYIRDTNESALLGIIDISAGNEHASAVSADGTVWSWGLGTSGQLGNGASRISPYAVKVQNLTDVKEVSCGGLFTIALKNDGTLWSWGQGDYGVLGTGNTSRQITPVQVLDMTDVKKVVTGYQTVKALKQDGTVWSWGRNDSGQQGIGTSGSSNYSARAVQVKATSSTYLTDVKDIATIASSCYALKEDGVYSWGHNGEGQLGNYNNTNQTYPVKIVRNYNSVLENQQIEKLISNSPSAITNYMIKKDGTILGHGRIRYGELLDGGIKYTNGRLYADDVQPSYLEITEKNVNVKLGETKTLQARMVENVNAFGKAPENGTLTWKSTDTNVATVSETGEITTKNLGYTTIIVQDTENEYRAQATVYVIPNNEEAITSPMVVQGNQFTGVLKSDGTVWMTGYNDHGELGNGTKGIHSSKFVKVKIDENTYLTNIVKIAAGEYHMLAVTKEGEVYSWGHNGYGQVGINSNTSTEIYAKKVIDTTGEGSLKNIIDVSAGQYYSIALDKDGNVYAWGAGTSYQLGNYNTNTQYFPIRIADAYNIVKISAGQQFTVLLRGDGVTLGTGANSKGQLAVGDTTARYTPMEMADNTGKNIIKDVYDIAAGGEYTLILKEQNNYVWGAGYSSYGQLKNRVEKNPLFVSIGSNVVGISAGKETTFLKNPSYIYRLGKNDNGQLGLGSGYNNSTYIDSLITNNNYPSSNLIMMAGGSSNALNSAAISKNGQILVSGAGTYGQLGNNDFSSNTNVPIIAGKGELKPKEEIVRIELNGQKQIEIDSVEEFNVFENEKTVGTLTYSSKNTNVATVSSDGLITAKRLGRTRIKITDTTNKVDGWVEVNVVNNLGKVEEKIISGASFTVALKQDGSVWSWGMNADGRLGVGDTTNRTEPTQVLAPDGKNKLTNAIDIAVGANGASALLEDGTVVSWGVGSDYTLGNGTGGNSLIPVYAIKSAAEGGDKLNNIIRIARGGSHVLALTKEGEVYAWGNGGAGKLGQNNTYNSSYAIKVKDSTGKGTLSNIIDIVAGFNSSYALTKDGKTIWAFGANTNYELGDNTNANKLLPVKVEPSVATSYGIAKISASYNSAMLLAENGTVWSWGRNSYGETATNISKSVVKVPTQSGSGSSFSKITNAIDIGTACYTHYILTKDGIIYASGSGSAIGAGPSITTNMDYYVSVKGKYGERLTEFFTKLSTSCNGNNAYFIRKDGSVFGVGINTNYQLLGKMTENLYSAKAMENTYMEITERAVRITHSHTQPQRKHIVETFNM